MEKEQKDNKIGRETRFTSYFKAKVDDARLKHSDERDSDSEFTEDEEIASKSSALNSDNETTVTKFDGETIPCVFILGRST